DEPTNRRTDEPTNRPPDYPTTGSPGRSDPTVLSPPSVRRTGPSTGRMNQNVLPLPKIDSHPMVPPCSSTNLRQSASPSPVPWARRLAELSTWLNSTNNFDMSWGLTPTPSSLTAT